MYSISYVPKEEIIDEGYGYCSYTYKYIRIRDSLPFYIKKFVLAHELQHEKDFEKWGGNKHVLWAEVKANFIGSIKHPIGFIGCVMMSIFSIKRWKLYINRIITKR